MRCERFIKIMLVLVLVTVGHLHAQTSEDELAVIRAVNRGSKALRGLQKAEGCWAANLESDAAATANFLLMTHYLGRVVPEEQTEIVRYLRAVKRAHGGWAAYPGGPFDLDVTVAVYAALRAAGLPPADPDLSMSRALIKNAGGLGRTGMFGRAFLAFTGAVPLKAVPYLSPKIVSVPRWFHPNVYDLPLARVALVPFGVLSKLRAVRPLPPERSVGELLDGPIDWNIRPDPPHDVSDEEVEGLLDSVVASAAHKGWLPTIVAKWLQILNDKVKTRLTVITMRSMSTLSRLIDRVFPDPAADRRAIEWILARQEVGGTFAEVSWPTFVCVMALDAADPTRHRVAVERGLAGLRGWLVHDSRGTWLPPSPSHTWDTAPALAALLKTGAADSDPAVAAAVLWLEGHQSKVRGDWAYRLGRAVEPGAWYFGCGNENYPDADDTAVVLGALLPVRSRCEPAFRKGLDWLLALQDRTGGWSSWDKGNKQLFFFSLEKIAPGVSDLPDVDITARALMLLGPLAGGLDDRDGRIRKAIGRAVTFLLKSRASDGTWYGHWCVNRAYATAQVLDALHACGIDIEASRLQASVRWLESVQNPDGGWGESRQSYFSGVFVPGPSNPMVTSVVLHALVSLGRRNGIAARKGAHYLVSAQDSGGQWHDPGFNATAIPGHTYLRYYLTPTCLSLGALASYLHASR